MTKGNNEEVVGNEGLDRRSFLKGTALGALGLASVGALSACSPAKEQAAAPMQVILPAHKNTPCTLYAGGVWN